MELNNIELNDDMELNDMELNEELKVIDVMELEKGNEYYINFYELRYSLKWSGLYKWIGVIKVDDIYTSLSSSEVFCFENLKNGENFDLIYMFDGKFIGSSCNTRTICDIYRLPINDYILK